MKAIDSIENYIISEFTDRALLLTGGWGAGKTYFWKNSILPIIEKNNLNPIYLSLHGVSTLEQLEAQFLTALLPRKMQKKVYGNAVNIVSKKLLGSGINEVFKGVKWPELSNALICYDDLERNKIDLDELWGFINYYIEHVNLKTIIISNEEEVNKPFYKNKKEKNISRSIQFVVDINDVYDSLISKYESPNQEFHNFLKNQKTSIVHLIEKFKIENLRTVSLYLENLRTVYNHAHSDKHSFHKVVLFCLIVTNEFALGNLSSSDLNDFRGLNRISTDTVVVNSLRREQEAKKEYNEIVYEKYLSNDLDDFIFLPFTFKYIVAGLLDIHGISEETDLAPPKDIPEHISVMESLMTYEFRKLPDEEFNEMLPKLLQWTKSGAYPIYSYTRIAKGLDFYRESGLLPLTKQELEYNLLEGIQNAFANSDYSPSVFDNILAFSADGDVEQKIREKLEELNYNLRSQQLSNQFEEMLELLINNNHDRLVEQMGKSKFDKFLKHGSPKKLVDTLMKCNNEALFSFEQIIEERYNYSNIAEFMIEELEFISETNKLLQAKLSGRNEQQLNTFLLKSIYAKFSDVQSRLDK